MEYITQLDKEEINIIMGKIHEEENGKVKSKNGVK